LRVRIYAIKRNLEVTFLNIGIFIIKKVMKKIVRLTERDLSRIIKRTIFEMEDEKMEQRSAMDFVRSFLEERGGTLGARTPDEIMSDLKELEFAIRSERNDMDVANQRPNQNWGQDSMDSEQMAESRYFRRRR